MNDPETFPVPSSDGVVLQGYDYGGDGPPLLVCHATGFCSHMYQPLIARLVGAFHCYGFDFRAHGASGRPEGGPDAMEWAAMAGDVAAVIGALELDRPPVAFGHSMGGAALVLAEAADPGLLEAAWTFEPILFASDGGGRNPSPISETAKRRRGRFAGRAEARERFGGRPPLSLLDDACLELYVEHGLLDQPDGTVALACPPDYEAAVFEFHNSGAREAAAKVDLPFVVAASGDGQRPAEVVIEVASECPNLSLVRFDDLTHFGPLQAPDQVAEVALRFLVDPNASC